jgi:hypothetical protein
MINPIPIFCQINLVHMYIHIVSSINFIAIPICIKYFSIFITNIINEYVYCDLSGNIQGAAN